MSVYSAVHKILSKARQLVDIKKDDGFAALHLAALNGHLRTAETLIDVVCIIHFLCFYHRAITFAFLFHWYFLREKHNVRILGM